jgi:hypothetical protein
MAFRNGAPARRAKNELVLCVGWRAYVNWAPPAGQPSCPVPMTDVTGKMLGNDLADGQEVEIVSWRPRSREGLSYQVRRISDSREWWIASTYLRRLPHREAAPPAGGGLEAADKAYAR